MDLKCNIIKNVILELINENVKCIEEDDGVTVYLPFLDKDMNYIYLKFEKEASKIKVSDKGDLLGNLFIAGQDPFKENQSIYKKIVNICNKYKINKPIKKLYELYIYLDINKLNNLEEKEKLLLFLNGIKNIQSLMYLPPKYTITTFIDIIESYFNKLYLKPTRNKVIKRGIQYYIDFYFDNKKSAVQAIYKADKKYWKTIDMWRELKGLPDIKNFYNVLDNRDTSRWQPEFIDKLKSVESEVFMFPDQIDVLIKHLQN